MPNFAPPWVLAAWGDPETEFRQAGLTRSRSLWYPSSNLDCSGRVPALANNLALQRLNVCKRKRSYKHALAVHLSRVSDYQP
jgi:hypothetical protein